MPETNHTDVRRAPLREVIGTIAAFWVFSLLGYYYVLPFLGYSLDYNTDPFAIAIYYLLWSLVSLGYFWKIFSDWLVVDSHIWRYAGLSLVFAACIGIGVYLLSFFPILHGPKIEPYTDLLFITPWYFLPKAFEVMLQQILITSIILAFYTRFKSFDAMLLAYAGLFVTSHIALFALTGAPEDHAVWITLWSIVSTFVFPYLILKIRGGFVYAYAIHLASYIVLAMILHTWPPVGYVGV